MIAIRRTFLFFGLLLLLIFPSSAMNLSADKAILMDAASGEILYVKDADIPAPPASTTKLMTALVVIESGLNTDDIFTVSHAAVTVGGSSLYLNTGESVDVETLLYGLLLESANDAAVVLAEGICESEEAFVRRMNEKAVELGMVNTHFENPHGMPSDGHVSTAEDLAKLMLAVSQNARLMDILGTRTYSSGERHMTNHNKLLAQIPACDGGKTGYTKAAGRCLVSTAVISTRRYIAVTLNAPEDWDDHTEMYSYAESLQTSVYISRSDISCRIPVAGGEGSIFCAPMDGVRIYLPVYARETLEVLYEVPEFVYAGIRRGSCIGAVKVMSGRLQVADIPLYAAEDVPQLPETQPLLRRIWSFLFGWLR